MADIRCDIIMEKKELSGRPSRIILVFIALVAISHISLSAAFEHIGNPAADSLFSRAFKLYEREDFDQAARLFSKLETDFYDDPRITVFMLMGAKSLFYGGDLTASQEAFKKLIDLYPKSGYLPACHYFLGKIYFQEKLYNQSARSFLAAANLTQNREHEDIYSQNLLVVVESYLNAESARSLLRGAKKYDLALAMALVISEKFYTDHKFLPAEEVLDQAVLLYPEMAREEKLADLRKKIEVFASRKAVLVLFAPISGELARFGRMMSNAFELAIEEYFENPGIELEKRIFDTFGNSIASAVKAREVTRRPISAIIGPLSSSEAVGMAPFAGFGNIPMIAPTASEKGLTSISDMLYQLTPTPERMGEALADFIISELAFDSVAILAPLDNYGKQITDGFVHMLLDSNVTIFYQKFYPRGSRDYRRFLLDLKKELLPDTFVAEIFLNEQGDTMEIEEIPVRVPAIFLPSYTSELKLILPQLRFYKISTIILGADPFGESEIVEMPESKDNPTIFVSKSVFLPEDSAWMKFNYLYQQKFDEPPQRVAAITYDAVNMVLDCVSRGMYTSQDIHQCFMENNGYRGAAGIIRFDRQRENIHVPVYLLDNGEIIRM